ncbi:hypothetical protein CTAYLR_004147 [Chrysophaeum taylorii]|uniref:(d)CMP kinase n=1 Tax=Chrysophaeum taylorii TaxID=2483200 RepID=A0AAD7XM67_9STRA|nr:hypothetical protein CTAYLR_004147 [Chrysophaeum taylorii]
MSVLANLPLVGRLFGGDEVSFSTLEDAQHIVEGLQAELYAQSERTAKIQGEAAKARAERIEELRVDLDELRAQKKALESMLGYVNDSIGAKEAAIAEALDGASGSAPSFPFELLKQADDATTNAIIETLGADPLFEAKAREAMDALLTRDAEDDEKLATGIALAVERGVLEPDVEIEPVESVDVTGRSADDVADYIVAACHKGPNGSEGRVVVLQGLSGTGKGTTVSKLLSRFESCVSWSNGNVFRSLTLLALEHCAQRGIDLDASALSPENLASWVSMLSFDLFPEGYDILVDNGEGLVARVSEIANTTLKEPRIGKAIPTVAGYSQGEVVKFANSALQRMKRDGLSVLVEGRAPTLAYVRSPFRFELVIDDPLLLGARRVAQRVVATALKVLDAAPQPPSQRDVDLALQYAVSNL